MCIYIYIIFILLLFYIYNIFSYVVIIHFIYIGSIDTFYFWLYTPPNVFNDEQCANCRLSALFEVFTSKSGEREN